jgi:D-glycero-alpha-D-manno-heptose-7-phosphate kinase
MLITRTPLRITLGGGGTDLPSYYESHGGMVVSAAISKHIYISINRTFTPDYFLKYSALERVDGVSDIEHPIVREVLKAHDIGPGVEIVSTADIPSGTGLGSSGSFTVGLLKAVHAFERDHVSASDLGREACEIEIDRLGRAVGKQDQYIAAFGGITRFDFQPGGEVEVTPAKISGDTMHDLEQHLLMFFTGYSRDADQVLAEQKTKSQSGDSEMLDNLHYVKDLGLLSLAALEVGDTDEFGNLMHLHWEHKKRRSSSMSNPRIDHLYDVGRNNGARGGKLVGAGAGGFLMFYADDTRALRIAMRDEGLTELRFAFDQAGSTVLVRE